MLVGQFYFQFFSILPQSERWFPKCFGTGRFKRARITIENHRLPKLPLATRHPCPSQYGPMVLIDGFVIWVFSGQYLKYQNQFFVFHKHGTHKVRFRQHPPLWVFDDTNPTIRNESLRSKPCQIHIKPIETIIVGNVWLEENGMQNSALLVRFLAWSFESNVSHAREACLAPPLKNEKSLASNFVRPRSVKISWNHWGISVGIHTGPTSTSTEIGEKVCGWSISINPNTLLQIQREAACDWNILKYIAQIFEG